MGKVFWRFQHANSGYIMPTKLHEGNTAKLQELRLWKFESQD